MDEDGTIEGRECPWTMAADAVWGLRVARELLADPVRDGVAGAIVDGAGDVEVFCGGFPFCAHGGVVKITGTRTVAVGRRFGVEFLLFSDRIAGPDHLDSAVP